jgi:hypothetical protein
MLTPNVAEISALSEHHRQVALVRWSLVANPEPACESGKPDPRNPLHRIRTLRSLTSSSFGTTW